MDLAPPGASDADQVLIAALHAGDERAFAELVRRYQPTMLRIARMYVKTPGAAEEVVQETWLGVLRGLDRFEGRSSVKTWIFRILVNQAKTRGVRDQRVTPFASLEGDDGPTLESSRFGDDGWWTAHPGAWSQLPAERLESKETIAAVRDAIAELPARQQEVIVLRDLVGLDGAEVSDSLGITEGNQRVLLHRARAKVRAALEGELA
ncbi:MAG: RNA polymerase sigma factor [Baekduiaceae bacterium]